VAASIATVTPACELSGIHKRYGGVVALAGVDLRVAHGQVRAIVGENGAGKSTLMKVLAGAVVPDAGSVFVNGRTVQLRSVAEANAAGVAIVFQELALFPHLDVLANLFLGREDARLGWVRRRRHEVRAREALDAVGLQVPLDRTVGALTLAEQQLLEIARGLLADSRVLILDEPNSALNAAETERLFRVIRRLRGAGVAILYISHRLEEVVEISDLITVMRDGRIVGELAPERSSIEHIVELILGQRLLETEREPARDIPTADTPPLHVEALTVPGRLQPLTFQVHSGEVLGLAGLEGSGVREVFAALFSAPGLPIGTVTLPDGQPLPRTIRARVAAGVGYVPPDRRRQALMLERSVADNLVEVAAGSLGLTGTWLRPGRLREAARRQADRLHIKLAGPDHPVGELSGGNQQKVVLGRWLEGRSSVLLLDDPTRGVDVGAKAEIYRVVRDFAQAGGYVLFSSSELGEYPRVCDRVIALYRGRPVAELRGSEISEQLLLQLVNTGRRPSEAAEEAP
jgi:ribose transport system ATP-binding protein